MAWRDPHDNWVYFVFDPATLLVKIGWTGKPHTRFLELQKAAGHPLDMLALAHGNHKTERALHQLFAADRVTGEWFRLTPALGALTKFVREFQADLTTEGAA